MNLNVLLFNSNINMCHTFVMTVIESPFLFCLWSLVSGFDIDASYSFYHPDIKSNKGLVINPLTKTLILLCSAG